MATIETIITVASDGSASLDAPIGLPTGRHRVILALADEPEARDANGWPIGFFARTYGSCADDPLPESTSEPAQEREEIA